MEHLPIKSESFNEYCTPLSLYNVFKNKTDSCRVNLLFGWKIILSVQVPLVYWTR